MPTLETSLSLREDRATANLAAAAPADTRVGQIWIPAPQLAAELGVSRRTIGNWLCDVALEFPRPKIINHRLYFERSSIEAWKTATAVKATGRDKAWPQMCRTRQARQHEPGPGNNVLISSANWAHSSQLGMLATIKK